MSSRTITYLIKLLSNIDKQANRDAQVVEASNQRMTDAYKKTGQAVDKSANQIKQAQDRIAKSAQTTTKSLDKMGAGIGPRLAREFGIGLTKLKQMQSVAEKTGNVLGKMGKGAGMTAIGGVAATVAAERMIDKPVQYESRVARMAQTAYQGKDIGGFKATQAEIETGIKYANTVGGGRRDDAAAALDNMVASGQDLKSAIAALPAIMKTATASGANAKDLSDIVIKGVQNGYIKNTPEAISSAMDKSVAAGRAGQFELPDMAHWLGNQMSAGKLAGLSGDKGFDRILMMNQAAMMSAGSKDEAGNNVVNLLAKLNSADTAKDFKRQTGGDLSKYLIQSTKKGGDSVDAWVGLLRDEMGKNKDYQAAQKKLTNAKTPEEQRAASESVTNIAMGTSVGKYFQDRQALAALIPLLSDSTGVGKKVGDAIAGANGTVDFGYQTYGTTTAYLQDQAANANDAAVTDAFNTLKPAIDGVIGSFTELAQSMPKTTATAAGIAGITGTIAAGVGGVGVVGMGWQYLKNRKGKANPTETLEAPSEPTPQASRHNTTGSIIHEDTAAKTPAPIRRRNAAGQIIGEHVEPLSYTGSRQNSRFIGPQPSSDSRLLNVSEEAATIMKRSAQDVERLKNARLAGRVGGLASAAVGVYDAYKIIGDEHTTRGQKAQGLSEVAGAGLGGWGGAYAGAAAGAALGSIVPILGTAIGGVLGGLAGGFFGSKYGGEAGHAAGDVARTAIDGSNTAQLTSAVQAGVTQGMAGMPNIMQQPPAYLNTPVLNQIPPPPQAVDLSIRDGKLQVQVQVTPTSSLIEAVARANQPAIPLQLAGGGNTNPASYGGQR